MGKNLSAKDLFRVADQSLQDALQREREHLDWKRRGVEVPYTPEQKDEPANTVYTVMPHMFLKVVSRSGVLALENIPGDGTNLTTTGFKEGDVVTLFLVLRENK